MKQPLNIFWFRRDLRLNDNAGLYNALKGKHPVLPIFIFDKNILDRLPKDDARVTFIYKTLQNIQDTLKKAHNSNLAIYYGTPKRIFKNLIERYNVNTVYTNHDYEPYASQRDLAIKSLLKSHDITLKTFKDHVIFEKNEVLKSNGKPYMVYTPYMKTWKAKLGSQSLELYPSSSYLNNLATYTKLPKVLLTDMGFEPASQKIADHRLTPSLIRTYESKRNFPALEATSRLGPHLRFGTVSIRQVVKQAFTEKNETFWQELIWREFFMQILWHYPHTATKSFKPQYDRIEWRNNENEFKLWCEGKTGYPLVDAGMRQLNQTGFMHNRVRMLAGQFFVQAPTNRLALGRKLFCPKTARLRNGQQCRKLAVGCWLWC